MILITYDLKKPGRDYTPLYELLKSSQDWAWVAESVWLLCTSETCVMWRDRIKSVVDDNDLVIVIEVTDNWAGLNLDQDVVDWLKSPSYRTLG